ncbi:MAG: SpoIIE family protein phosphatase [bacterium]|nr:SpoIIE family protein phosphatase [bacterium]
MKEQKRNTLHIYRLAVLLFLLPAQLLVAQSRREPLKFQHLGLRHGVPQSGINCILQDKNGFMWFGTRNGLNRYDGYNFVIYNHDPKVPDSLSAKRIQTIYEDLEGTLWLGTSAGLDKYNRGKDNFTHFKPIAANSSRPAAHMTYAIFESKATPGMLLISTLAGLQKFDKKTGTFTIDKNLMSFFPKPSSYRVNSIVEDKGILWLAIFNKLIKYDLLKNKHVSYKITPEIAKEAEDFRSVTVYKPRRETGHIWLGGNKGLLKFDIKKETFSHYCNSLPGQKTPATDSIYAFCDSPVEKDVLWVGTARNGLVKLNTRSGSFSYYEKSSKELFSLSGNSVTTIYQDSAGVLWVGTLLGGLNKVDRGKSNFIHYKAVPDTPGSLSSRIIWEIHASPSFPDLLWLGTGSGLIKMNRKTSRFDTYPIPGRLSNVGVNQLISSIYECASQPGVLWIGTRRSGLYKYLPRENKFISIQHAPTAPPPPESNFVTSIHESPVMPGTLWLGTFGGLYKLNITSAAFSRKPVKLPQKMRILAIRESPACSGNLWLGSMGNGLLKLEIKTGKVSGVRRQKHTNRPPYNSVFYIHESQSVQGVLWLATEIGLFKINRDTSTLLPYRTSTPGLLTGECFAILEETNGTLWISNEKGLLAFHPQTGAVKKYDERDGLQGNLFSRAAFKCLDGEMFFGGYNGFNAFYPQQIKANSYIPPVVITEFQLFNNKVAVGAPRKNGPPILNKTISGTNELTLAYHENVISFHYSALNYLLPEKNMYAYKMEGFDQDWNVVGKRRVATYTALPHGNYVFHVKGSNNDGLWNEKGTSIRITILPPWWKTWWAYCLYFLFITAVILGLNRMQRIRLMEKATIRESHLRALAAEAQALAVEAENKRKTQELDSARQLQLSMLPQNLPQYPGLEIAVYMKTASEVGGDYYDFSEARDGTLTVAVGDATGHGLKAGTMVAFIKGVFLASAHMFDINTFFNKSSFAIKLMRLKNLFMALALVRLEKNKAVIASAGMPPIYLFRAKEKTVETITLKEPPIGSFKDFKYKRKEVAFLEGDTMLLLSDGLPELFNRKREMFGYSRVQELYRKIAGLAPERIIEHLVQAGEQWSNGLPQDDDITFVVLKKTTLLKKNSR